jgi:hypothetical protein
MNKILMLLLIRFSGLFAASNETPQVNKQMYVDYFYRAFYAQCQGKSLAAMTQFNVAYQEAEKSGEDQRKLNFLRQLFVWYRTFGHASFLFAQEPIGYDQIVGEYKRPYANYNQHGIGYNGSEWGNNPEQAALVREFMMGVAETIGSIFGLAATSGLSFTLSVGFVIDGVTRMSSTLIRLWSQHESAMLEWKKIESAAQTLPNQNK